MGARLRHLAAATTGMTFGLILLGVYTGAIGAGLACGARWPFCDGWLGLFPATWPSFVEWFHRLVAMITGFMILGVAYWAWRDGYDRRVRYAATAAVAVLPVQILLGANTIFSFGPVAQVLHHGAALFIFGAMIATTVWTFEAADADVTDPETDSQTENTSDPVRL